MKRPIYILFAALTLFFYRRCNFSAAASTL